MFDPVKKWFNANPDNQRGTIVKLSLIVVSVLILISIIIRLIGGGPDKSVNPEGQKLLKYDREAKDKFMNDIEKLPDDDIKLSKSDPYPTMDEERRAFADEIARRDFSKNGQASDSVSRKRKVNEILNKAMESDKDESKAKERKVINPYWYSYEVNGKREDSYLSPYWRRILSPEYKAIREYTGCNMLVFNDEETKKSQAVEKQIKREEGRQKVSDYDSYGVFPPGTVIKAVTIDRINSDFPSVSRCRITSPYELSGSLVLLKTSTQTNNRVSITPSKIVFDDKGHEIKGVVKSGLPGLTGSVNRHVVRKTLNPLAAAGLIAYGTVFGSRNGTNISTEDAIRAQMIQEGLNIGVNELNKYGGDVPNTVDVKIGTPLEILLLEELSL